MLFVKTYLRHSSVHNTGCFLLDHVLRGTVVGILVYPGRLITESALLQSDEAREPTAVATATRWIDNYFTVDAPSSAQSPETEHEAFINHSFRPSLLFHCGICFAMFDLAPDAELTVNYQYVLSEHDPCRFVDAASGRTVCGLPPRASLLRSASELLTLFQEGGANEQ